MGNKGTFKYVFIPADVGEPLQELSLGYTEADEVQCLLNTLRVKTLPVHLPYASSDITGLCLEPDRLPCQIPFLTWCLM